MSTIVRRNTRQRQVILEVLRAVTSHPTAAEIYEMARTRLPRISLGTVYRNLEFLADGGMIQRLEAGGGEARFDGNARKHLHVRCVECGRVADVHESFASPALADVAELAGYSIVGYQFEFLGVCPHCRKQRETANAETRSEDEDQR